jgi:hypothetical protein
MEQPNLARFAWLSIGAALATMALKALERLERDIRAAVPGATVFTHLEPVNDPAA